MTEILQVELLTYLNSAFAACEFPTTGDRSWLSRFLSEAVLRITDTLDALVEAVEGVQSPPAVEK